MPRTLVHSDVLEVDGLVDNYQVRFRLDVPAERQAEVLVEILERGVKDVLGASKKRAKWEDGVLIVRNVSKLV